MQARAGLNKKYPSVFRLKPYLWLNKGTLLLPVHSETQFFSKKISILR
jgi:hypothetical protein